mgnify:CR=1 FL=1
MKELQTELGKDIPLDTRSILYLCELENDILVVKKELFFTTYMEGLDAYANIRNPASQLIEGKTYDDLIISLNSFHRMMKRPAWIEMLKDSI